MVFLLGASAIAAVQVLGTVYEMCASAGLIGLYDSASEVRDGTGGEAEYKNTEGKSGEV